jgi:hypothetical protein
MCCVVLQAQERPMPEQASTEPNVEVAGRWAIGILLAYAIIPVLLFVFLLLFPQSRDDALEATGYAYLYNIWVIVVAYKAYKNIKSSNSLTVKGGVSGALVILGLVGVLCLILIAAFYLAEGRSDGQVVAFFGYFFLMLGAPILGAIGWTIGADIGWAIERRKVAHKTIGTRKGEHGAK